jgi:hypothetical protein
MGNKNYSGYVPFCNKLKKKKGRVPVHVYIKIFKEVGIVKKLL